MAPIAAPPYKPNAAPANPPPTECQACIASCCSIIVTGIILFLIASLILHLLVGPEHYYIPEVEVSSIVISDFVLSAASHLFSAKFDVTLAVSNPGDDSRIHYDGVAITILYEDQVLAFARGPPFHQDEKGTTNIKARNMSAVVEHLDDGKAEDMESERSEDGGKGHLSFQVKMSAYVRFWWVEEEESSRRYEMKASCEDVPVGFSSGGGASVTGTLAHGRPVNCRVDV